MLESGKNVVTTVGYVYPKAYGRELVERFERACAAGGSSLHGTGVNPGWMGELLPLTMSAMCARIDQVYVLESTEFSRYPSRDVIIHMMGFGKPAAEFDRESKRYRDWLSGLFCESVEMIADGLAIALDEIERTAEFELAPETFDIAAGTIDAGTIAGQRFCWSGIAGGEKKIVLEAIYRARRDLVPEWADVGGIVRIEGRPRRSACVSRESWNSYFSGSTADHGAAHSRRQLAQRPGQPADSTATNRRSTRSDERRFSSARKNHLLREVGVAGIGPCPHSHLRPQE